MRITTDNQYEISTFDTVTEAEWSTSSSRSPEGDWVFAPEWTSDGKSIIYHNNVSLCRIGMDGELINKMKLDSFVGRKSSVSSSDRFVENPVNANIMAFTRMAEGTKFGLKVFGEPTGALFTYDKSTKKLKRISKPEMIAMDPCWSRDGKTIYFSGYNEKDYKLPYPFKIYRINPDGTGLKMITKGESPKL
ncbi:MAG: TolB family protein [Armatimonadota bacterium]